MTSTFDTSELQDLLQGLFQPTSLTELGALMLCLALAWLAVRMMRGATPSEDSVWFGQRIVDGVLFPLLALALAFAARELLSGVLRAAVFKVAIPVLLSLVVIRLTVRVLTESYPASHVVRVIERSVSWLAWLAVLLWVTGVLPVVLEAMEGIRWKLGVSVITLRNVVEGSLTAGIVMVIALWIASAIERRLLHGTGADLSLRKMMANVVRALLIVIGLMLALSAVGIDLTALSVLGGAFGVGLGFGLQRIAANYVSGFVVLAERSLRIGDTVKVDNFDGRITDIRTRYTVIRALNGREAIVPNEMLVTQRVENASLADHEVLVTSTVQVAHGSDVRSLQRLISEAVARVPRVVERPAPDVHLSNLTPDGLELLVLFWIRDPENGQSNVKSQVNLAVLDVLTAQGVGFASSPTLLRMSTPDSKAVDAAPPAMRVEPVAAP